MCFNVDKMNSVIIIANTCLIGHVQDNVQDALHIFTDLNLSLGPWG